MNSTESGNPAAEPVAPKFMVAHQKIDLDFSFDQQISGTTEITIYPESQDLREIRLHGRQCNIKKVLVNNTPPSSVRHRDPCEQLALHCNGSVNQHHLLTEKIAGSIANPPDPDIIITLPKKIRILPVNIAEIHTQSADPIKIQDSQSANAPVPEATQALSDTTVARFTPLTVFIEFESCHVRESVQFVVGKRGSGRWPHAYTRKRLSSGGASSLFPCVDIINSRCTWDISIRSPRTVGDAIDQISPSNIRRNNVDGSVKSAPHQGYEATEMVVICSGELTDDIVNKNDTAKKTVSFSCLQQLAPEQLGFAIGPFEKINLGDLRDAQEVEELGRNAVEMLAYCLPGRTEEAKNTCLPTPKAMDFVVNKYISCPVRSYAMIFVEDLHTDTSIFAGVTMCSTRILYPEEAVDPAQQVTRQLAFAIVSQWIGINIVAETPTDTWVILGAAYYIANLFMRDLCGNNEYRYYMKQQADRVYELDIERPSIYDMGALLHVDPSEYEFLILKSPVVLFILDRRIAKTHGASKMPGILAKIMTRARTGDLSHNALSTELFQKTCERFHHSPIEDFITQWVRGAGCPRFGAFQRFNKKKLVVEMLIKQTQGVNIDRELDIDNFMRDAREDYQTVYAAQPQLVFTGPMTIRIHEADGTPYEHIVEIKDASTQFDIPYNTKYKRLKRSKKQRARASTKAAAEGADEEGDSLVYCLGDVLQSEEDVQNWRMTDWSVDDEERMNSESYEWIRLDADFEWICRINLQMPGYMFASQLQQDRDVVAQLEAVRHLSLYPPTSLISSIFIRTLMDRRYFHGVRSLAAHGLVKHAKNEGDAKNVGLFHLRKAFEELHCVRDQGIAMTRPNDFSDQQAYRIQCDIVEAIANVRDSKGHTSKDVKDFLLDKLKFNDNSANEFSDAYYISRLMKALTTAVIARPVINIEPDDDADMDYEMEDTMHELRAFERQFLEEIDRYRRMDEWTSSYQNLYSRTALECQAMLAAAGIGLHSPLHFLQYTRPGNYEMLRQTAYTVLLTPGVLEEPSVLRYLLYCMVADPSPWIRQSLHRNFGKVLAKRAIGIKVDTGKPVGEGLVIEDASEPNAADRQLEIARRSTIEGAVAALKKELGDFQPLKAALWNAICYDQIILEDLQTLLDFCRLIYEPVDEMKVVLRLPRYWEVENQGKVSSHMVTMEIRSHIRGANAKFGFLWQGKLKFKQGNKVRQRILPKWQANAPTGPKQYQTLPPPLEKSQYNVLPPPLQRTPSIPAASPTSAGASGSGGLKLKLKFGASGQPSGSGPKATPTPPPPPRLIPPSAIAPQSAARTPTPTTATPGRVVLKFKPSSSSNSSSQS